MVKHHLADGRTVDSIEGYVIPTTGPVAAVYHIVAECQRNHSKMKRQNKERKKNATA